MSGASANDELYCWAALHAVEGMGPVTFRRLVDRFGSAKGVLAQKDLDALLQVRGVARSVAEAIARAEGTLDQVRAETDRLLKRGVRLLRPESPGYPASLRDLPNPPPLLYILGEITEADRRAVGMVGTTRPSDKGRRIAEEFAARLVRQGITIVSGFAHGIDAASHRGAFRAGGRSALVVPYGIRHFKARPDMPPLREIAKRGALVSERPPGAEWSAPAAIARNRIIAALGRALFVVETRRHGGAMHTVKAAEQLRRPIFALQYARPPEPAGGNAWILARGGRPIRMFGDLDRLVECVDGRMSSEGNQA